jgi:hypothetical protein
MNARPSLRFKLDLASHLKKTVAEIDAMDSREFSQWIAYSRWFRPLDNPWLQTGMLASSVLAPYCKNKVPEAQDFVPVERKAPQHPTQIAETLRQLAADLGQK